MIAKHESEAISYLFSTVLFADILVFCPAEYEVFYAGGYKEMSSILADNSALVYKPKCGGDCGVSANENSGARHVTWSPNKLWRSNSIHIYYLTYVFTCLIFFVTCSGGG